MHYASEGHAMIEERISAKVSDTELNELMAIREIFKKGHISTNEYLRWIKDAIAAKR